MADSFGKKDREKQKRKRKEEKAARKERRKAEGIKGNDIMYVDEFGNFTTTPPDLTKKKSSVKLEDIEISVPKAEDIEEEDPIRNGTVKFFNTEKGYGFIIDDLTGDSYFAHINNLRDEITQNDKVQFEVGSGPKGPIALEVRLK